MTLGYMYTCFKSEITVTLPWDAGCFYDICIATLEKVVLYVCVSVYIYIYRERERERERERVMCVCV